MSEITKAGGGALAIRADQTTWTDQQAAVLRQSGIKDNVSPAELSGFLHLCQRTGLDPFSRQIYLIGRWSKKDGRDVYTPQTGIDGYRVIAQRVTAQSGGTYGYEDTLWCDPSGRWRDVWLADAPPAAAKVTVIRNGHRFSAVATFREYVQTFPDGNPKGLWAKMPAGQLAKCAEALALRKAFPHDLAGVYTAEEMAQADDQAPGTGDVQEGAVQRASAVPADDPWQQRDFLREAHCAPDADTVRRIWQEAKAAGAPDGLLARVVEVGRAKKAEAEAPADGEVVDAEVVEPVQTGLDTGGPSEQQMKALHAGLGGCGVRDREHRLRVLSALTGRPVETSASLSQEEWRDVMASLDLARADGTPVETLARMVADVEAHAAPAAA